MVDVMQILSTMLVAVAFALSLAHALEFPGKRRLDRATYTAMQPIYYPGFTVGGGVGDVGGLVATLVLLVVTPIGTAAFWLTGIALLGLVGMLAVYWLITHPVNKAWLQDQPIAGLAVRFFDKGRATAVDHWTELRDRWEYSHLARAVLAGFSLLLLVIVRGVG